MCTQPVKNANRDEIFSVDRRGKLVRAVTPERGEPYEHRCPRWAFEAVCHRFDEHAEGDTVETIAAAENMPITQAATTTAHTLRGGDSGGSGSAPSLRDSDS